MKVFELMAQLAKFPAGAEIEFRAIMTDDEFASAPVVDTDDYSGARAHSLSFEVVEAELISDSLAVIYR